MDETISPAFLAKLDAALAALPDHEYQVLGMHRWYGVPYGRIAKILRISVEDVEKAMASALYRLHSDLSQPDDEDRPHDPDQYPLM